MIATISQGQNNFQVDLANPMDISISLIGGEKNVNAWYLGPPEIKPERFDDDIVSVSEGACVNFNTIKFKITIINIIIYISFFF